MMQMRGARIVAMFDMNNHGPILNNIVRYLCAADRNEVQVRGRS